jgi:mono/diheme cytochrome c family protein
MTTEPAPAAEPVLTDAQKRGEALFLKHCPLCHVFSGQKKDLGIQSPTELRGLFKSSTVSDAAVRQLVTEGVPGKMPSFRHALASQELDDVLAYLKVR